MFSDGEKIPALSATWYSALRDSYGLPKNTRALNLDHVEYRAPRNDDEERAIQRYFQMYEDFKVRPKVLTPYSWEFIEEKYLYHWVNDCSNLSYNELKEEDRKLQYQILTKPEEVPEAGPPLQVK